MRKRVTVPILSVVAILATLLVATPAAAHGYVSSPPSRQANCAQGRVTNCGDIVWEPQSVEAPKGSMQCNGGGSRFAVLNDNTKAWPVASVGNDVTFNWVLTARHRTSTWEYFVGGTRIAVFNDNGAQPGPTVSHNVSLGGRTGRMTVLARWNVYDTAMAFYSCVDIQVGGGGGDPTPPPPPPPSPTPPTNPPPPPRLPAGPGSRTGPTRSAPPLPTVASATGASRRTRPCPAGSHRTSRLSGSGSNHHSRVRASNMRRGPARLSSKGNAMKRLPLVTAATVLALVAGCGAGPGTAAQPAPRRACPRRSTADSSTRPT